jgi:hypothetical protein
MTNTYWTFIIARFCTNGIKNFLLECPAKNNKSICDNLGKCCSIALLQSQLDFQNHNAWLQRRNSSS